MGQDIQLVDLELNRGPRRWLLRIFIDRQGGVNLDHCEQISQLVGAMLEVDDPIPGSYILEVSSPGLDRPLKSEADFIRFQGRLAKVKLKEPLPSGERVIIGRILETADHLISLEAGKKRHQIPYASIAEARLEVEFP